jgi:excisionase family DNA binding protein
VTGGKLCLSVDEVAETVGVCKDSIYKAIRDRRLIAVRFGRRSLVRREDLERFIRSLSELDLRRPEPRRVREIR